MTNPYQPSFTIPDTRAERPRFVLLATLLACLALAAAWIELAELIRNCFRSNTTVHFHDSDVLMLLFVSLSMFCLWSEWVGSASLRSYVNFALAPLVLLTFVGLYRIYERDAAVRELADTPSDALGSLAFLVIWLYAATSFRSWFKAADNHDDVHESTSRVLKQ